MTIDLSSPRRLHVVGVGGTGMNAVAAVLIGMGHDVSGSDLRESVAVQRVRSLGATVFLGHDPAHVVGVEAVVTSTAVPESNPEIHAANASGIPVLHRSEVLGLIAKMRKTVAVAGTHGKTTTSSMITLALRGAGVHPSFVIGGDVNEIGTGAGWDDGDIFVVEADESDGSFLRLGTGDVIVTSIEADHLEHYGSDPDIALVQLCAAFEQFVAGAPGVRVVCIDDEFAAALTKRFACVTYGTSPNAHYRITDLIESRTTITFVIEHAMHAPVTVHLPVPGVHNARNATAAYAYAIESGVDGHAIIEALERFGGVARRFEFRGEARGVTFIDDYAHIPGELVAALHTAAAGSFERVIAVFQPHRYSRTESLWRSFANAFVDADVVVLTDIYGAGESPRPGVNGHLLVRAILDAHPRARVVYLPRRADLVAFLDQELRQGDACVTLGAGDITSLGREIMDSWEGIRDPATRTGENGQMTSLDQKVRS